MISEHFRPSPGTSPPVTEKGEAAGFLGMSVEVLVRMYRHHHPAHLRMAAQRSAIARRNHCQYHCQLREAPFRCGRKPLKKLVADAVQYEPVSQSKFPDNWENTGNSEMF
jgi:hypothetical protein